MTRSLTFWRKRGTYTNLAGCAGELFYASGEVAVKAPHASASSHAPRLALQGARQPGSAGSQPPPPPPRWQQASSQRQQQRRQEGARESGEHESVDVEVQLKEAMESLSVAEAKVAELAREATQARFELEDEQVAFATAETKVGVRESRRGEKEGQREAYPRFAAAFGVCTFF